jgi:hypothetical protein
MPLARFLEIRLLHQSVDELPGYLFCNSPANLIGRRFLSCTSGAGAPPRNAPEREPSRLAAAANVQSLKKIRGPRTFEPLRTGTVRAPEESGRFSFLRPEIFQLRSA